MSNSIELVGNLGGDPNLRFLPQGDAVANFSVGDTPRRMDKTTGQFVNGETLWLDVEVWGSLAENVANSLKKGDRVVVLGRLVADSYTDKKTGERKVVTKVKADSVSPDLRFATAQVTKSQGRGNRNSAPSGNPSAPAQQSQSNDWASAPAETPF